MAAHGEIRWPPLGRFNGRLWGESHGRRHPGEPRHGEPDIGVGQLDPGPAPPPYSACIWLSRHPGPVGRMTVS
jgi:hypothetical protein